MRSDTSTAAPVGGEQGWDLCCSTNNARKGEAKAPFNVEELGRRTIRGMSQR